MPCNYGVRTSWAGISLFAPHISTTNLSNTHMGIKTELISPIFHNSQEENHSMKKYFSFATFLPELSLRRSGRLAHPFCHCHQSLSSSTLVMTPRLSKVVLVDMDNTLVNFDKEFGKRWAALRPGDEASPVLNREHFELEQNFSHELRPLAEEIMSQPGFFIAFQPVEGAIQAVREMLADGLSVFFCTAPLPLQYETCVAEKYAWVRKHLGEEFLSKIIVTRDKTVIKGAVLIDDKPRISGACPNPEWTHVVFEQPYNRKVNGVPRMTSWSEWRKVVIPLLSATK